MSNTKLNNSQIELVCSDWELDFYSRPILEKNGKKRWELIIASSKNFYTQKISIGLKHVLQTK